MPAFIFSVILLPCLANALMCISHHEFREDGKIRKINLNHCGASNGFCVKVHYWDTNPSKKRGYSRGCDRNDCENFGDHKHGWKSNGCRKPALDFGSDGEICCCQEDLCNSSPTTTPFTCLLIAVAVFFQLIFNPEFFYIG